MSETISSTRICERVMEYVDHRLERQLRQVGTIGDHTSPRDIEQMANATIPWIRSQFEPEVSRQLSNRDLAVIQAAMRQTAAEARAILERDSITQRLERSLGAGTAAAINSVRGGLASLVRGTVDDGTPPLPFLSRSSGVVRRCAR